MPEVSDEIIVNAVIGIIRAADTEAVVTDGQLPGIAENQVPDMARSAADNRLVHCWEVWAGAEGRTRPGNTVSGALENQGNKPRKYQMAHTYQVRLLLEYRDALQGNARMREAGRIWRNVANAFSIRPRLGLTLQNVEPHDELQRLSLTLRDYGDTKTVQADGYIIVRTYLVLNSL